MEGVISSAARWVRPWPLLFWLATGLAWGQGPRPGPTPTAANIRSVIFVTQPAGASLTDQYGSYLGQAGQPTELDVSKYGSLLELTVRHPDCRDSQWDIHTPELDAGRVPASGAKELPMKDNWRAKAIPALGFLLLGAGLVRIWSFRQGRGLERERRETILSEVDQSDSLAAKKLGPYRLLQRLGAGGMATVYRAVKEATMDESEAVAIKVLRRDALSDPEMLQRFRRESLVTSQVNHPNIVRLMDWGEEGGYPYLVMELIEGGNLRERLKNQAVAPADAWLALEPLCAAIGYAHSKGIVHRDLKPENLMITSTGLLKVADFGLARGHETAKVTATGNVLGTPTYMAPEQIQGDPPAPSMDQYAIGVIAFEMLTGRPPFQDPDPVRQIFQTLSEPAGPPSRYVPLTEEIDQVVLRMLEKDPAARFADITAASTALQHALTSKHVG